MVCWDVEGHGCLGFHMGGINISGGINQSFYPRTRHGELKVISMIYAPPYLMRRRSRRCSRSHVRKDSEGNHESTQEVNTEKAINGDTTITTELPPTSNEQTSMIKYDACHFNIMA